MSMSENTENFERLRRLLALKRHEQPPPRYFIDFSSQVIARIKRGERTEGAPVIERLFWEAPWLQRIWGAFETKPILAGIFGVAVCGLLMTGVIYSDRTDSLPVDLAPVADADSTPLALANVTAADHPLVAKPVAMEPSSTKPDPYKPSRRVAFGRPWQLRAQPASFSFPGGN